jgi:hypothetical protein
MSRPLGPDSDLVCSDLERKRLDHDAAASRETGRRPRWNPFLHGAARYPAASAEAQHPVAPKKGQHPGGVIDFVASNPGSTAGDVARARGLDQNSVATRLVQLAKSRAYEGQARLCGAQLRVAGPNASLGNARSIIAGSDRAGIAAPIGGTAQSQSGQRLERSTFCMANRH